LELHSGSPCGRDNRCLPLCPAFSWEGSHELLFALAGLHLWSSPSLPPNS
jgi:hypothetical protein